MFQKVKENEFQFTVITMYQIPDAVDFEIRGMQTENRAQTGKLNTTVVLPANPVQL
jgi:hypothetical protein